MNRDVLTAESGETVACVRATGLWLCRVIVGEEVECGYSTAALRRTGPVKALNRPADFVSTSGHVFHDSQGDQLRTCTSQPGRHESPLWASTAGNQGVGAIRPRQVRIPLRHMGVDVERRSCLGQAGRGRMRRESVMLIRRDGAGQGGVTNGPELGGLVLGRRYISSLHSGIMRGTGSCVGQFQVAGPVEQRCPGVLSQ